MGYLRPVPYARSTSWSAHRRRNPPSSEAGIDMFCPIGTPVRAADAGRIADTGDSIGPATGRFVTIDLDDGRRVRYLHLSRRTVSVGARVTRGQTVGYSGATGYGEEDWSWNVAETGGAHVHMTLWPSHRYVFGGAGTLDPEPYFDPQGSTAGSDASPIEENIMNPAQEAKLDRLAAAVQGIVNALNDPEIGIHDHVLQAAGRAADAVAVSKNVEGIVAGMSNAIADPNIGILVASNDARADARAALEAIGKLSGGAANIDVAGLANELRAHLGAEVAAEVASDLAARLAE